jgi:hypothetical protein
MWASIGAWLWRFIGGLLPVGQKPFPEWLGKILWAVCIWVACYSVVRFIFPDKPVIQNIGTQNVQTEQKDVVGVGCNIFRLYVKGGLRK